MNVWWFDGNTTGNLTKGTDYRILDAARNDITNSTDETPLYGFRVEFTDAGIATLNGKKDVCIRYHSTATYAEQPENTTWVYHNTGAIPDHSKDVSTEHYKQQIIDKMSSATGPATVMSNGKRNYNDNDVSVDKDAGIIYYRVVVAIPQGTTGDIDLLDTIDPGLTYNNLSSVEIHGYGNDNYIYNDNEAVNLKVTSGTPAKNSDGSTSVHFIVTGYTAGKSFVIYYQAKVEDPDFWNNSKNYKKDYSNSISWNTHSDGTKTTVEKERTILDKTAQQETDSEGDKYASYNIVVNPSGRDLDTLHSTLDLVDTVSGGNDDTEYYLDVSSIKVYRYDQDNAPTYRGNEVSTSVYTYKYDTQSKKLTITIPDEFACVVAYRYHVNSGVNDATLNNTAQLTGISNSSTSASTKIEASSSGAHVYQYNMNIYKVDSDDYTLRLSGVTI